MNGMASSRRLELLLALLGAVLVLLLAWLAPWLRFVLTIALAKGLAVLGILLLIRAGQISFGHALFMAFSAYAVAFLAPTLSDAVGLIVVSTLLSTILGVAIGSFVARYREIFFGMLNLALSMVFFSLLQKLYSLTGGTDGLPVAQPRVLGFVLGQVSYEWVILVIALALSLAAGCFVHAYLGSPMGQALAAIKTRETRLEFLGVSARRILLAAYILSALLAGSGGAILALTSRHVTPDLAYWTASGELVFIAILGGAGSVLGPFLGAVVYELVRVYAAATVAEMWQLILGAVLLVVILFFSRGLWGVVERLTALRQLP
jgi:branched-chain amino acid transport system permease protein